MREILRQLRIWRLARSYASAEMGYENADYAYRSLPDSQGYEEREAADRKRFRAARRLLEMIHGSVVIERRLLEVLVHNAIRFGQENNVQYPDTIDKLIKEVL